MPSLLRLLRCFLTLFLSHATFQLCKFSETIYAEKLFVYVSNVKLRCASDAKRWSNGNSKMPEESKLFCHEKYCKFSYRIHAFSLDDVEECSRLQFSFSATFNLINAKWFAFIFLRKFSVPCNLNKLKNLRNSFHFPRKMNKKSPKKRKLTASINHFVVSLNNAHNKPRQCASKVNKVRGQRTKRKYLNALTNRDLMTHRRSESSTAERDEF